MTTGVPASPPRPGALRRRWARAGLSFVLPWVLGFLAFQVYPLGLSLLESFQHVAIVGRGTHWVGFTQYRQALFGSARFDPILLGSFLATAVQVPLVVVFALAVALLLDRRLLGGTLFKTVFFIPVAIGSSAVVSQIVTFGGAPTLVSPGEEALLAATVGPLLAGELVRLLADITVVMWHSGIQILLLLAGLRALPRSVYEAARVDGANAWQVFHRLTLPLLRPILTVTVVYSVIASFTAATNPMMRYLVAQFLNLHPGYDSAVGWLYFAGIFVLLGGLVVALERRR